MLRQWIFRPAGGRTRDLLRRGSLRKRISRDLETMRGAMHAAAAAAILLAITLCLGACAQTNPDDRRFFRPEYGLGTHGRKTWFDHLVEVDPGGLTTQIAPDYERAAPQRIAVLPFTDLGSANYVVNKIPLTHRDAHERENWAWTDANRMRRSIAGYMAQREFLEANLLQIDAIMKLHGIDSEQKLEQVPPQTLGKWLGVDAVVYGSVTHYEAYYGFLISAWQVGADVRMVSTHDGEQLFSAAGSRYSVYLQPAWDPIDIAINSALGLLQLRDVVLARAEEEDAREIVLRIPRSERLQRQLIEEADGGDVEFAHQAVQKAPDP
jgi:hypothetical protein